MDNIRLKLTLLKMFFLIHNQREKSLSTAYQEQHSRWRTTFLTQSCCFSSSVDTMRWLNQKEIARRCDCEKHEWRVRYIPARPERDVHILSSHAEVTNETVTGIQCKVGQWRHTRCCLTFTTFSDNVIS